MAEKKDKIVAKKKTTAPRTTKGRFPPKTSGNPKGRPKKFSDDMNDLRAAIKRVSKAKGKAWWTMVIERSYTEAPLAVAILNKLVPNLASQTIEGPGKNGEHVVEHRNGPDVDALKKALKDRKK